MGAGSKGQSAGIPCHGSIILAVTLLNTSLNETLPLAQKIPADWLAVGNISSRWQTLPSASVSWESLSYQKSSTTNLLLVPMWKHCHQDHSQNTFEGWTRVKTYRWSRLLAAGQELPCAEGENWFRGESFKAISATKIWLDVSGKQEGWKQTVRMPWGAGKELAPENGQVTVYSFLGARSLGSRASSQLGCLTYQLLVDLPHLDGLYVKN